MPTFVQSFLPGLRAVIQAPDTPKDDRDDLEKAQDSPPSSIDRKDDSVHTVVHDETIYVEYESNDPRNPINFSLTKKWTITAVASFSTLLTSSTASSFASGYPSLTRDLATSQFEATVAFSMYALGFGVVPLITASFSEEFGRRPLYLVSGLGFALMYIMIAESKNIQTAIVARFLQGSFGSTAATMVGGTIADIWPASQRGVPMALFSLAASSGNGVGPAIAGWIEMNSRLGWRWTQWILLIITGFSLVLIFIFLEETRSTVLLMRLAKKMRTKTGDHRYRARIEDERLSLKHLIWISCTRPVRLLLTEHVVLSFSLWIGFAWGVTYCMIESVGTIFRTLHDFNDGQVGLVFLSMLVGSLIGFFTNFYQEYLYKKYQPARGPEARLYCSCGAAFFLPIAMFIYAWCSFTKVHWMGLVVAITLFIGAMFVVYLAVFSYLADCYGPYASSALAGQSLARNLMGTAFPLFTTQMYTALQFKWANTLFGFLALAMIPIPFVKALVLFFYGPVIRQKSKFSRRVLEAQQEACLDK